MPTTTLIGDADGQWLLQQASTPTAPAAIELERTPCPQCASERSDLVVETPDFETRLGGLFRVVRCRDCTLAYTNPRPTESTIGSFYSMTYAPHHGHRDHTSWRERIVQRLEQCVLRCDFGYRPQPPGAIASVAARIGRAWLRSRRRRVTWIPFRPDGRLLDFGCGAAQFAQMMQARGWSVEGIDASRVVSDRVSRETGIRIHHGSLPHPQLPAGSFDVVTMWASLEHVHRPRAVIAAARELLKPNGLLIASVPNFASWAAGAFADAWWGLDLPRHLVHFTPQTLSELLRSERLQVLRVEHVGRDGWLRHSAARAWALGKTSPWRRACRWKPLALACSRWSEIATSAESIVAVARRA